VSYVERSSSTATWIKPALMAALGFAFSLVGFFVARNESYIRIRGDFEELAARRLAKLQDTINVHVTLLRSIAGFYAASNFVERDEFTTFIREQPLAQFGHPILEWVPRVPPSQRPALETQVHGQGLSTFHIWPVVAESETTPDYFPVLYVEPLAPNESLLGYDIASDPERRMALEQARDSGEVAATGRVQLRQAEADEPALMIAYPIYNSKSVPETVEGRRAALDGFALGTFRIHQLIETSIFSDGPAWQDTYVWDDAIVPPEPRLLYFHASRARKEPAQPLPEAQILSGYHWQGTMDVPGRKWTVVVRPAPGLFPWWGDWTAWVTLVFGLVLTFLVTAYEWSRTAHMRRIEGLAADLSQSHARLKKEIAEREEMEERLRQSQKVEAVGHLTGGVAHDFNNLLTIIIGGLEILEEKLGGDGTVLPHVRSAMSAAVRGAALTQRLLAFARRQVLDPEILDVNFAVIVMQDLLQRTLGKSVQIRTDLAKPLWPAVADRNQVESALLNLAVNARDAMPEGGVLTIETENLTVDAEFARRTGDLTPGDYVMLAVSDTGCGMSPETLKRAIEPFFTTKERGKGTGLGLSSVFGFAKQSGGHLKLYSQPGRGTTVRLFLPRSRGMMVGQADRDGETAGPRGGETVLVVEDDPYVRGVAVAHLIDHGYHVLEADTIEQALVLIEASTGGVDLLLTDMSLAGSTDDHNLAARASERIPWIKVLYMSGFTDTAIVKEGQLETGVHFLQKPFRKSALLRAIREVLDAA
jgi:signal transduction histidine kinase/ActR/RegA family two-component response regulator